MMILRSSAASPFGRKIKIAATVLGLRDRISVEAANTVDPADSIRQQNPLGKIPALILEDGGVLYDSRVIAEYLDFLAGGQKIIPAPPGRFDVLRLQALADGITDAAILRVYEGRFRPVEKHEPKWLDHQAGKIDRGLKFLEASELPVQTASPDLGAIALACMLGYLDLRTPGWRPDYPKLAVWVDTFERTVPVFTETRPSA